MTVGFFSPLPPARTGVADYSAALLAALNRRHTVSVGRDGDVNLYHVGNNQLHASIYRRALEQPGIVVLHDALLHHMMLGSLSREQYIEEFVYNYGEWTRGLAQSLWGGRSRSAADPQYFRYSMLKRLAERSRALIVHNPAAAAIVRSHHATAKVHEIPHLLIPQPPVDVVEAERLRQMLCPAGILLGVFGHLRESKRVLPLLRLFADRPGYTLVLAGAIGSSDLLRAVEHYSGTSNVHRIGYMTAERYGQVGVAVDLCVNLRYPTAGETSGVTIGMMGLGKPVMLTDSLENSLYPDHCCFKITAGLSEEDEMIAVADWISNHRSVLPEVGAAALAYVRSAHAVERVTDLYSHVIGLSAGF